MIKISATYTEMDQTVGLMPLQSDVFELELFKMVLSVDAKRFRLSHLFLMFLFLFFFNFVFNFFTNIVFILGHMLLSFILCVLSFLLSDLYHALSSASPYVVLSFFLSFLLSGGAAAASGALPTVVR